MTRSKEDQEDLNLRLLPYSIGTQVVMNEERQPILYDDKGQPLVREMGFKAR